MELNANKQQLAALKKLRVPQGPLDLTGENVQKLKDKNTKKAIEAILQKALPRRRKGIQYSSYYRALRVKLLPVNPHFQSDVNYLRHLFQIPEGHISVADFMEPVLKEEYLMDEVGKARAAVAANKWIEIHRSTALKYKVEYPPPIPKWFRQSAKIMLDFGQTTLTDWIKKDPIIPNTYAKYFQLNVPLDRCVARLIERYRLPWLSVSNLRLFILTHNSKYLEMFPVDVIMEPIEASIGMAYRITVDWIDEYTTEKQWREIWEKAVVPRLENLWEERGEFPQSKRIELESLNEQWVIELYKLIHEHPGLGVDAALEELSKRGGPVRTDIDRTTAFRSIKRLKTLMQPVD